MSDLSVEELKARIAQLDCEIEQEQKRHAETVRAIQVGVQAGACAMELPNKCVGHALTLHP